VIQRVTGVLLDTDEARYLVEVLEHAVRIARPSARVADITRRLRRTVDAANAAANGNANGRAPEPDPGHIRAHDLLTAGDAARVIECTTANIRWLRQHGHLPAHRAGNRFLYPAAAVVEYAEHRASKRR
jgi:hypothetical protein